MIIIMGTGANGGVLSVINDYINSGLYRNIGFTRLVTHIGKSKIEDLFLFLKSVFLLLAYLCSSKVEAVHVHLTYNGSFWRKYIFFRLVKIFKVPFICHLHGSEFKEYVKASSGSRMGLLGELVRESSSFIVLSDGWKKYIDETFDISSIVINNFIDLPEDAANAELKPIKHDKIVFVGALISRKGILDLLQAYYLSESTFELHICGDGPLYRDSVSYTKEHGLENRVFFHGWISGKAKYQLFSDAKVFVLPTYNEGLPLTILEAIASRCLVISTPVGAIPEVISNRVSGYLFEPGDINELSRLLKLVSTDDCSYDSIAEEAYKIYVQRYTSKKVLPLVADVYKKNGVSLVNENLV